MKNTDIDEDTVACRTVTRSAQKVDDLGLREDLVLLYAGNISISHITIALNEKLREEGCSDTLSNATVWHYIQNFSDDFKKEIKQIRQDILVAQIDEWESQAMDVRREAMGQIHSLISDELKSGVMTARTKGGDTYQRAMTLSEKKDLANILMKKISIQESGERMAGIGSKEGKRYGVDINIKVDMVDDLRGLLSKKAKQGAIDVKCESVK